MELKSWEYIMVLQLNGFFSSAVPLDHTSEMSSHKWECTTGTSDALPEPPCQKLHLRSGALQRFGLGILQPWRHAPAQAPGHSLDQPVTADGQISDAIGEKMANRLKNDMLMGII